MVCSATSSTLSTTPSSDIAAHLIERNYADLGCDRWDTRRVRVLMAKLGSTPAIMAARLRVKRNDFDRRMDTDCWTKQDGLILTMLEREIDFLKGGIVPPGRLINGGGS